jgi:hypothetical protein
VKREIFLGVCFWAASYIVLKVTQIGNQQKGEMGSYEFDVQIIIAIALFLIGAVVIWCNL